MYEWLKYYERDVCIVATKADKIPRSKWDKHIKIVKHGLSFVPEDDFVLFSSETGLGKDELWSVIERYAFALPESEDDEEVAQVETENEDHSLEMEESKPPQSNQ